MNVKFGIVGTVASVAIVGGILLYNSTLAPTMPGNAILAVNTVDQNANIEAKPSGQAQCKSINGLPDPICSPGCARTQDTNIICHQPAGQFRPTKWQELAFKKKVMIEYGVPLTDFKKWILDHVIPIEDGGDGFDLRNMFLQTIGESKKKDLVEHFLKRQICTGSMTAAAAQTAIATNWKTVKIK